MATFQENRRAARAGRFADNGPSGSVQSAPEPAPRPERAPEMPPAPVPIMHPPPYQPGTRGEPGRRY